MEEIWQIENKAVTEMEGDPNCQHLDFGAEVHVNRLSEGEGGPVTRFTADVRIVCAQCGCRMTFSGLPHQINLDEPTVGLCGLEASLPLKPYRKEMFYESQHTISVVMPE